MKSIMLEELAYSVVIARHALEVIPRWRIATPEGDYVVYTRFADDEDQRAHAFWLISKFLIWKMSPGFIMTGKSRLTKKRWRRAAEAIASVGVSRNEACGVLLRITREPELSFGELEWLAEDHIDPAYRQLLPANDAQLTTAELTMVLIAFGEGGEFPAKRLD